MKKRQNYKRKRDLDKQQEEIINQLMNDKSYQSNENNCEQLFIDEDKEREYWLIIIQMCIRNTIDTIKHSKEEIPLITKWEEEEQKNI